MMIKKEVSIGQITLHASRCIEVSSDVARRAISFLSAHTGKVLPDIFGSNGVTTTRHASRPAWQTQVIALIVLQKQRKAMFFGFMKFGDIF